MQYAPERPLLDLGKGLRDRLETGLDGPSARMKDLLERMAGLPARSHGSEGDEGRRGNERSGA